MISLPRSLAILLLAAVYVAAGHLGLALDAVSGFATLVWAPSGIALAALLLFGLGLWPGVAVGALVVNLWQDAPLAVAAGIAVGNTLEPLVAAYLLRRVHHFRIPFGGLRDVLALIVLAAGFATTVSATVGVLSLVSGGIVPAERFGVTWMAWWVGDAIGVLVVAPLLLTWGGEEVRWTRIRALEALGLALTLVATCAVVFFRQGGAGAVTFLQPYLLFAPLLWAALRFETRGAATATFSMSALAIAGTVSELGPFQGSSLSERLWALQAFIGIMAVMFLLLAALAKERGESERALVYAKEAAESSSGAKSRFLAVMSHELRTPLTSIIGYADLLESEIVGPLNDQQKRHLARVRLAGWHLVSIIDGVITFSRAEAGHERSHPETLDAVAVAAEVVAMLEPQAAAKGIRIRSVTADASLELFTDGGKLRQILLNLVGNAVKFSERGRVELMVARDGDWTVFRVRDQGPGIPRDQLPQIFEPFSTLTREANAVSTGMGLGLNVALSLTRLLGGTLTVESAVGKGSTFTVRLPTTLDDPTADPATGSTTGSTPAP